MADYRNHHARHHDPSQEAIFSPTNLDPQFESVLDTLSQASASLNHTASQVPSSQLSHSGIGSQRHSHHRTSDVRESSLQMGMYASSLLFGLGVLLFGLAIPSLRIGNVTFGTPFLLIASFCTVIGAGCMMFVGLANDLETRRSHGNGTISRSLERLHTVVGMLGLGFLLASLFLWLNSQSVGSGWQPSVLRLSLIGICLSAISIQMQFASMLDQTLRERQ